MSVSDAGIRWESATEPMPSGDTLAAILHDARAFILRYVVATSDQATTVAIWMAHTHAIDAADTTPYLQITSATKGSGKTRLLEILEPVVRRPWFTTRTSAAALVWKIDADQPTLLLDESDAAFNGDREYAEALRGVLNSGYKRSGAASLCVGKGADLTVKDFSTFSPKAIAGIGQLPDTVASRAIPIVLQRRLSSEPVQRWRDRDGRAEAEPLRLRLMAWRDSVIDVLRDARPEIPSELPDRAADVWEPLLAIADLAGGDWSVRARRAAVALMGTIEDSDPTTDMLVDIRDEVLPNATGSIVSSKTIVDALVALDERPWPSGGRHDERSAPAQRLAPQTEAAERPLPHAEGVARRSLRAVDHPLGWECRLFAGEDEMIITEVLRSDAEIEAFGAKWRAALSEKGWH